MRVSARSTMFVKSWSRETTTQYDCAPVMRFQVNSGRPLWLLPLWGPR